jgi:hypothetical protein
LFQINSIFPNLICFKALFKTSLVLPQNIAARKRREEAIRKKGNKKKRGPTVPFAAHLAQPPSSRCLPVRQEIHRSHVDCVAMGRTSSPLSAYKNCDPSLCKPYPSPSLLPCSAATPSRSSSLYPGAHLCRVRAHLFPCELLNGCNRASSTGVLFIRIHTSTSS